MLLIRLARKRPLHWSRLSLIWEKLAVRKPRSSKRVKALIWMRLNRRSRKSRPSLAPKWLAKRFCRLSSFTKRNRAKFFRAFRALDCLNPNRQPSRRFHAKNYYRRDCDHFHRTWSADRHRSQEEGQKEKKFSNDFTRAAQELEGGLTKSSRKVAKAVREALDEYESRRDESAEKEEDGVLRDWLRNGSKALRKGLPIAAEAPSDFLDTVADMKAVRKFWRK